MKFSHRQAFRQKCGKNWPFRDGLGKQDFAADTSFSSSSKRYPVHCLFLVGRVLGGMYADEEFTRH